MAGPITMALGAFMFHAHGFGYTDTTRKLDTRWVSIDVADRFEALQWTGPKSESVTIKGVIFAEEFGGLGTLEGLRSAAINGEPLMLVTLSGEVHGRHIIETVDEDRGFMDAWGKARRNAYSIDLKRYTGSEAGDGLSGLMGLF